jgi:secretion/DNA translocation related TadE-like protein
VKSVNGGPTPSQRGAGTLLVAVAVAAALAVAAAVLLVVGYSGAQRGAVAAADLTALAGAASYVRGQDVCAVAEQVAQANRVRLTKCEISGDSLDFVVSVTVERALYLPFGLRGVGLPEVVQASSQAGRLSPP